MLKKKIGKLFALAALLLGGCTAPAVQPSPAVTEEPEEEVVQDRTGDIEILFTSDMHCGIREGFGVVGLQQIRETLEARGISTLLVDDGDAVQGDIVGTLTKGSAIVTLMNDLKYDAAIPGNHEFDYGADNFMELTKQAEYPYISCNFRKQGERVLDPYVIKEAGGKKIAFIGVTTPKTLGSSSPANFMDENGEIIYDFEEDLTGELLFETIQKNVDEVRSKGVDYVILMCHMGNEEVVWPYNFMTLIENTSGIDVLLDGHSHDSEQVVMNNRNGEPVLRSACGTKLQSIGYVRIPADGEKLTTGLYSWGSDTSASELFGLNNSLSEPVQKIMDDLGKTMELRIGETKYDLATDDPEKKDANGAPVRIVRCQETNLGDLAADAFRHETGADIGLVNGGSLRAPIAAGEITYGDIINVLPFSNQICVSELTGQQILDALEWGCRAVPGSAGSFLHPSGLTYEIHADLPADFYVAADGQFAGVSGEYRVKNVMVGGQPLDPEKKYTVASFDFLLKHHGSGFSMMGEQDVVRDEIKLDNQALIDYIKEELNGVIGEEYADPYGQGRIKIFGTDNPAE